MTVPLLTAEEVAERLRCSKRMAYEVIAASPRRVRVGRLLRIPLDEVECWVVEGPPALPRRARSSKPKRKWRGGSDRADVYVVRCEITGLRKVGSTRDLGRRMANLRNGSPTPLVVDLVVEGAGRLAEKLTHGWFSEQRAHGEWFRLTDADVEQIRGRGWERGWE